METVYEHLIFKGMDLTYITWFHHGEKLSIDENPKEVKMSDTHNLYANANMENEDYVTPTLGKDEDFTQRLEDAETPLYPSCTRHTKLSATIALYKHKVVNKWSDKSFDGLLELLHDMLPVDNVFLRSVYSVRKLLKTFDLGYEKIHACVNDCCLFRKEKENMDSCPTCGLARWIYW